ncbi:MAG: hypothetical protein U9R57_05890, partial [Thermodesulfobacteriota bacterium]|nr:hypothetical protein [Thermodesulfobacteriota bacterium]
MSLSFSLRQETVRENDERTLHDSEVIDKAFMKLDAPIIIKESAGIPRIQEPVTVGIPIPKGVLTDPVRLSLIDSDQTDIPLQATPLAHWPDGSIKWILLDFQARIKGGEIKELQLQTTADKNSLPAPSLSIDERDNTIIVDTGSACFHIPTDTFKPFSRVVIDDQNFITGKNSTTVLTDPDNLESIAVISSWEWETRGPLRSTVKFIGNFLNDQQEEQLSFIARLSFFAGMSTCKVDFTLWNPRAAIHPGGLWDLGDPGSFYFNDLSIHLFPKFNQQPEIRWQETVDSVPVNVSDTNLLLYQDSSGGTNWQSKNHVNRDNAVKTSFQGYKVSSSGKEIKKGLRAEPGIAEDDGQKRISAVVQYFWQNFPKALEADDKKITIRFFPHQYNDVFELQGGERKTHTCLLDFQKSAQEQEISGWMHKPLEVRSTPEWYAASLAVPYLIPDSQDNEKLLPSLIRPAIEGNNTFFDRREVIDEYGWRNFGDWYADHEAVGYKGPPPMIAHYNNQYDGIYGTLCQYIKTGDYRWFLLGDQLCQHVRDIDIYNTDNDKPEFNKGLLWHTEHYLNAETVTHRCFSKRHAEFRNLDCYGGGPAMSHNYANGLLYHHYLTGDVDSKESVLELADFIQTTIKSRTTLTYFLVGVVRKLRGKVRNLFHGHAMVDFDKVYSMNGPGRGSGNAISTLMTAYELTKNKQYLQIAEDVIQICIHPADNIEKMDMLDIENRWMYTVFLQALGKYLDTTIEDADAQLWKYVRDSLLHYSRWMVDNEYLYLETPQKLEYPNETWAAQEIRKCNVLLYAAKYSDQKDRQLYLDKAMFFFQGCLRQLQSQKTRDLTRPITLLLQNALMPSFFQASHDDNVSTPPSNLVSKNKNHSWGTL